MCRSHHRVAVPRICAQRPCAGDRLPHVGPCADSVASFDRSMSVAPCDAERPLLDRLTRHPRRRPAGRRLPVHSSGAPPTGDLAPGGEPRAQRSPHRRNRCHATLRRGAAERRVKPRVGEPTAGAFEPKQHRRMHRRTRRWRAFLVRLGHSLGELVPPLAQNRREPRTP